MQIVVNLAVSCDTGSVRIVQEEAPRQTATGTPSIEPSRSQYVFLTLWASLMAVPAKILKITSPRGSEAIDALAVRLSSSAPER
jgi:hypothetical protein